MLAVRKLGALLSACLVFGCVGGADEDAIDEPVPASQLAPIEPPAARDLPLRWSSRGNRAPLRDFELRVTALSVDEESLRLALVFENVSENGFVLAGDLSGRDLTLADSSGALHSPVEATGELDRLDSGGGLPPGVRRSGEVLFRRPAPGRVELQMPGFGPIGLEPDQVPEIDWASSSPVGEQSGRVPKKEPRGEGEPSDPTTERDPDRTAIEELLVEHAKALDRRDFDGYLETFVGSRRLTERDAFTERTRIPLRDVSATLGTLQPSDSNDASDSTRRAKVILRYFIDGVANDNPFVYSLDYSFTRTQDGWRVDEIGHDPARSLPWRQGPLTFHRSNHFLIYTSPRMQGDLVELAGDAEAAYADLYRKGLPMTSGYLIWFSCDPAFEWRPDRVSILGRALATYQRSGGRLSVHSRLLFINACLFSEAERYRQLSERRQVTMTHELVHLALSGDTRPYTPLWLVEGAAVFFSDAISYDETRRLVRDGLDRVDLDSLTRAWNPAQAADDEYLYSGNAFAYLVARHGLSDVLAFYSSFRDLTLSEIATLARGQKDTPPSRRGVSGDVIAEIATIQLRKHFGVTLAELDREVRAWLELRHR